MYKTSSSCVQSISFQGPNIQNFITTNFMKLNNDKLYKYIQIRPLVVSVPMRFQKYVKDIGL